MATKNVNFKDASGNILHDNLLNSKVDSNTAITGATKTKITYDEKGLITSGADATTADIADSSNKRYCTDAEKTVIGNTSGTNTGDETQSTILTKIGYTPENSANKNQANGYAGLDENSKINIDQIPAGAVPTLVVVADETARFALTTAEVQNGDTVKQNDTGVLYYVVDDTNLDNASGYEIYSATTDWSLITNKPTDLVHQTNYATTSIGGTIVSGTNSGEVSVNGTSGIATVVNGVIFEEV